MHTSAGKWSPKITDLIRLDHKAVEALFARYRSDMTPGRKRALSNTISLALGLHAELEEELLYAMMRPYAPDLVRESIPEHREMMRRIIELRYMDAADPQFDDTVRALQREVEHHVREEETSLLPRAEQVLGAKLRDLGAQMNARRLTLARPVAGKVVRNAALAMPGATLALTALALLGASLLFRRALPD